MILNRIITGLDTQHTDGFLYIRQFQFQIHDNHFAFDKTCIGIKATILSLSLFVFSESNFLLLFSLCFFLFLFQARSSASTGSVRSLSQVKVKGQNKFKTSDYQFLPSLYILYIKLFLQSLFPKHCCNHNQYPCKHYLIE